MNTECSVCNNLLDTDSIWCFSTVDADNIVIGCECDKCGKYFAQLIKATDFKEVPRNLFNAANGPEEIVKILNQGEE